MRSCEGKLIKPETWNAAILLNAAAAGTAPEFLRVLTLTRECRTACGLVTLLETASLKRGIRPSLLRFLLALLVNLGLVFKLNSRELIFLLIFIASFATIKAMWRALTWSTACHGIFSSFQSRMPCILQKVYSKFFVSDNPMSFPIFGCVTSVEGTSLLSEFQPKSPKLKTMCIINLYHYPGSVKRVKCFPLRIGPHLSPAQIKWWPGSQELERLSLSIQVL